MTLPLELKGAELVKMFVASKWIVEAFNGLYKAEMIKRRGPWKTKESVEMSTLQWVHWFNHIRLLEPIGYIAPAKGEDNYYRQLANSQETIVST